MSAPYYTVSYRILVNKGVYVLSIYAVLTLGNMRTSICFQDSFSIQTESSL